MGSELTAVAGETDGLRLSSHKKKTVDFDPAFHSCSTGTHLHPQVREIEATCRSAGNIYTRGMQPILESKWSISIFCVFLTRI